MEKVRRTPLVAQGRAHAPHVHPQILLASAFWHTELTMPQVTTTPYRELNSVLAELLAAVRSVLADNFRAAYLHGSFAVGDFDEHSDVDFMIVTERDLGEAELLALQALHARLHALPTHWARRLE